MSFIDFLQSNFLLWAGYFSNIYKAGKIYIYMIYISTSNYNRLYVNVMS